MNLNKNGGKNMSKYISVIDDKPSANKKGLRVKVQTVELDENNNLLRLHIDYSGVACTRCGYSGSVTKK